MFHVVCATYGPRVICFQQELCFHQGGVGHMHVAVRQRERSFCQFCRKSELQSCGRYVSWPLLARFDQAVV
jgi:hypothetical protein